MPRNTPNSRHAHANTGSNRVFRRYHVLNNPLSFTDPSGFFFGSLFKAIGSFFKAVGNAFATVVEFIGDNLRTIGAIAFAVVTYALAAPTGGLSLIATGAVAGFGSGLIASGGDLKAGLIGAVTGAAFAGIGPVHGVDISFTEAFVKVAAHGAVGGVRAELSGGDFLTGFAAAGFVAGFSAVGGFQELGITDTPTDFVDYAANAAAGAVVGGVGAVIGGGKFENGALTGAFSRLFGGLAREVSRKGFTFGGVITKGKGFKGVFPNDLDKIKWHTKKISLEIDRAFVEAVETGREQGGYVYQNKNSHEYWVERIPSNHNTASAIHIDFPHRVNTNFDRVVGTFHVHPLTPAQGGHPWFSGRDISRIQDSFKHLEGISHIVQTQVDRYGLIPE